MREQLIGQRFGRLVVSKDSGLRRPNGTIFWECSCDCGGKTTVRADQLKSGESKSCGCRQAEAATKTCLSRTIHGNCRRGARTAEFRAWESMRYRCENPKSDDYANYGGRGIKVCKRWHGPKGFQNFLNDMGPKPTPEHSNDRKNNDGDYKPSNCHWATPTEQANNKRKRISPETRAKQSAVRKAWWAAKKETAEVTC